MNARQAFTKIRDFSDLEMRDGDAARAVALEMLIKNTEQELALLSEIDKHGELIRTLLDLIASSSSGAQHLVGADVRVDGRWYAIAATRFQEGFMALKRCIERPEEF